MRTWYWGKTKTSETVAGCWLLSAPALCGWDLTCCNVSSQHHVCCGERAMCRSCLLLAPTWPLIHCDTWEVQGSLIVSNNLFFELGSLRLAEERWKTCSQYRSTFGKRVLTSLPFCHGLWTTPALSFVPSWSFPLQTPPVAWLSQDNCCTSLHAAVTAKCNKVVCHISSLIICESDEQCQELGQKAIKLNSAELHWI